MKNTFLVPIFFCMLVFSFSKCFCQTIGIGTDTPEQNLHIAGDTLSIQGIPSVITIKKPTIRVKGLDSLSNNLSSDNYPLAVFSDANGDLFVDSILNNTRSYFGYSTGPVVKPSNSGTGPVVYTEFEIPTVHNFTIIPGMTQNITVTKPINQLNILSQGGMGINSNNSGSAAVSYAVGVFLNNQLIGVRAKVIDGAGFLCVQDTWNIYASTENLTIGAHQITIGITLRDKRNIANNTDIIWCGSPNNTQCTNYSEFTARGIFQITIVE